MAQKDDDLNLNQDNNQNQYQNENILIEMYKTSREAVKHYDNLRWKRLTTYLYSTALLFTAVGFSQKYLHYELMSIAIMAVGFFFTACLFIIEYRSADPLKGWVQEAHRLEELLGGRNKHTKSKMAIRQRHAFRVIYILFGCGWITILILILFLNHSA